MWCLEAVSGLKVNFKSDLIGVRVDDDGMMLLVDIMGCTSTYLGMPLCAGSSSKAIWNPVVEIVEGQLANWKATSLSVGGRITLIQEVVSYLPVDYMSLFKCSMSVLNTLEKLQRYFLW